SHGNGTPGRVIRKQAYEISTCRKGLRPGSEIYEYMPCKRSLQKSEENAVRQFARLYNYFEAPQDLSRGSSGWNSYIDALSDAVNERRRAVLDKNGYTPILNARGYHAASNDAATDPLSVAQTRILNNVPWV